MKKKMEIIIKPEKLEELKDVLNESGIFSMSVTNILGCGNQIETQEVYRGTILSTNLIQKVKVETVVKDSIIGKLVERIRRQICTSNMGDGKIFIYMVQDAIKIRAGEIGEDAI